MKLLLMLVVWVLIAVPIGIGMVWAVNGAPWLLILSMLAFVFAFARWGCLQH